MTPLLAMEQEQPLNEGYGTEILLINRHRFRPRNKVEVRTMNYGQISGILLYIAGALAEHVAQAILAVYNGRRDVVAVTPINHQVYRMAVFLEDQFRIGGIFYDLVFIPDGGRDKGMAQLLHYLQRDLVIGYPDAHRLFFAAG